MPHTQLHPYDLTEQWVYTDYLQDAEAAATKYGAPTYAAYLAHILWLIEQIAPDETFSLDAPVNGGQHGLLPLYRRLAPDEPDLFYWYPRLGDLVLPQLRSGPTLDIRTPVTVPRLAQHFVDQRSRERPYVLASPTGGHTFDGENPTALTLTWKADTQGDRRATWWWRAAAIFGPLDRAELVGLVDLRLTAKWGVSLEAISHLVRTPDDALWLLEQSHSVSATLGPAYHRVAVAALARFGQDGPSARRLTDLDLPRASLIPVRR